MTTTTTPTVPPAPLSDSAKLREIAFFLREHALAEEISYEQLLRDWPALGSTKTLKSCADGQFEGLNVSKLLALYNDVFAQIQSGGPEDADPLYEDLEATQAVRAAAYRLKMARTLGKLVIVEGFTGSGKTSAARHIEEKYNALALQRYVHRVSASAGWGRGCGALLEDLLKVCGQSPNARSNKARLDRLKAALNEREMMFIVDEVHDLSVEGLRTLKTLISDTKAKFMILGHPRLLRTLMSEASDDLSQLIGNRLLVRVQLSTLSVPDAAKILFRRTPKALAEQWWANAAAVNEAAKELVTAAAGKGNLAFVRQVCLRLNARKAPETLTQAIRAELKARAAA